MLRLWQEINFSIKSKTLSHSGSFPGGINARKLVGNARRGMNPVQTGKICPRFDWLPHPPVSVRWEEAPVLFESKSVEELWKRGTGMASRVSDAPAPLWAREKAGAGTASAALQRVLSETMKPKKTDYLLVFYLSSSLLICIKSKPFPLTELLPLFLAS